MAVRWEQNIRSLSVEVEIYHKAIWQRIALLITPSRFLLSS